VARDDDVAVDKLHGRPDSNRFLAAAGVNAADYLPLPIEHVFDARFCFA
jgi:hypothetical protein